ncbi:fatty acid synthase-like [Pectinophora gossypiella]|uniref:fatty acid synthase-like n=1 Tax=Pectinophora gossypiella TaxID=13191 RepID=UPI00214F34FA|nr:fatty acid synthase-like [Pectinophora gossypiella]XP_049870465.1 fatty acid synthase-like [Pectinophora gossypiella]
MSQSGKSPSPAPFHVDSVRDDDIYITGISGYFPESDSVKHLGENLFNKVDLITDDERRWKKTHPEIPQRTGKLNNIDKFDASFFDINYKQAHIMDPMSRILLEKAYECIIDAGVNPSELRNTNTGVFLGLCFTESDKIWQYEKMEMVEGGILWCSRSMIAARISHWLGVQGPSHSVDSACSSSIFALEHAVASIRNGNCDAAIVGGANLVLHPIISLQFARLGVLSPDGVCKSFDNSANGYVRSEAISACFLQKAKDSRRVYAHLVHAKTNCDGYKEQGITYPAGQVQKMLLKEFYDECQVPPSSLEYLEAHGTGTRVGDPEELTAIDDIFCPGRSSPLYIGSVKSNLGHTEGCSGLCSVAKLCIAYSTGYIPPNINFKKAREGIAALAEGRLRVVTEKTPWNRGMSGISSFGFGGANGHVLLRNVARHKVNNGLPVDVLPRLVCVSGRTESAVGKIFDDLESKPLDVDQIRLWHAIHERNINGHDFRGYVVMGSQPDKSVTLARDIQLVSSAKRLVWFAFSELGSNWAEIAHQLMTLPAFATSIQKCHRALHVKGFNLIKLINDVSFGKYANNQYYLVGTVAVHIGITDVLATVGIKPDYIVGHENCELGCAYADGCLTAEQAILAAYSIVMAWKSASDDSSLAEFIASISHNSKRNAPKLVQNLREIIPSPKSRSERWISVTKGLISEYHSNFLTNPVVFEESVHRIQSNAVVINLGLSVFLTPKDSLHISLVDRETNLTLFLTTLGRLYQAGLNLQLAQIYPYVQFPVAQGTPMLADLVKWEHSEHWNVVRFSCSNNYQSNTKISEKTVKVSLQDEENECFSGHTIDGRIIYPATGYLILAWNMLAQMTNRLYTEMSVVFEDVYFQRATNMPKDGIIEFTIVIHKGNGKFEIIENGTPVVTGRIYEKKHVRQEFRAIPPESKDETVISVSKRMYNKDFYKELSLRGYQYSGLFRGVMECEVDGKRGRLLWANNWVSFLDTMLQVKIVAHDTRLLYVPTRIEKISIDVDAHYEITNKLGLSDVQKSLEFRAYNDLEITRAGGAEIRGIHVTAISKKPALGIPIYEKNQFVPNNSKEIIMFADSLRANLQLILENINTYKFKTIELVDEEYKNNNLEPVIELVCDILGDLPLIQAELLVLSEDVLKLPPNVTVSNKKIIGETNTVLFIGANLLKRSKVLSEGTSTLRNDCFVLSRETILPDIARLSLMYDYVTEHFTGSEYLILLRKKRNCKVAKYIEIVTKDHTYSWIDKVKGDMKDGRKIVLYNQNEKINGLLGLVNCLRKEPGGELIYGVLISDPKAPQFNPNLKFYKDQLDKELAVNVFKDGQWGTYRHLLLKNLGTVKATHAYVNTATIGDLTSLRWWEGSITKDKILNNPKAKIVHVYYSAMNFRDVMTAMGRVTLDAVARGRLSQDCVQGIEVAGRTANGCRVMAICDRGISNIVQTEESLIWPIPDEWTLEEAATVPVAYGTVFMALIMIGKIRSGESILIHAGSGGVGQAAISVALHHGLEVFTTVGTPAKRAFIKRLFPQIKDSHIGNSRDISFEHMIRRETKGRGVDVVLNSLSDDKLQASAKCLTYRGRFLEIGKYDITINTQIEMCFFKKEISFHGVMLDYIYDKHCFNLRTKLGELILGGVASGAVRPLTYCSFDKTNVEAAYRYMAAGKHIGKVLIKIRDEEPQTRNSIVKPSHNVIDAEPRYMCSENEVYVLVGGLGGIGLELADWLILRGARKILMCSRIGISNGYQALRIRTWQAYGSDIQISTHDVTSESGCEEMLKMAATMGSVRAIFNLAVVLNDAIFSNQTPETFKKSYGPKASTTIHLDKLSRKLCPELKDFVVFSSVSCGRGNAGQTNYGFSNSVMERICEERKSQGFPALAIQWGAIGDVGLVADMQIENIQMEIGGTLQQRISSCMLAMDKFLKQDAVIVSSIVVAEKRLSGAGIGSIVDAVAHIMGIADLKTVSQQVPLSEIGMDSIMAVEIKQTLEREFEIFLAAQEIRTLTFARLVELDKSVFETDKDASKQTASMLVGPGLVEILLENCGDEELSAKPFIDIPGCDPQSNKTIFMLPGLEGCATALEPLCKKIKINTCVMQLGLEHVNEDMDHMVQRLYKTVKSKLSPGAHFYLLGYSFGTLPILKLAQKLENEGHEGVVFCLDGSPEFCASSATNVLSCTDDFTMQNSLLLYNLSKVAPNINIEEVKAKVLPIQSYDERIKTVLEICPVKPHYSIKFTSDMFKATFYRLKSILNYDNKHLKLKADVILLRPIHTSNIKCNEHYGLDNLTEKEVKTHLLDADHVSIIEHDDSAKIINSVIDKMIKKDCITLKDT